MKIAYVFHRDAADPSVQSGRPASLLDAFRRAGVDITPVFPLEARPGRSSLTKKIGYRLLGRHHRGDREPAWLAAAAAEFDRRVAGDDHDLVFSPGSEVVSHLRTDRPVAFCADATFANMVDYYWDFSNLSEEYLRKGRAQETAALARASLAVYPSGWAAASAINDHGADPARVAVIPFGANLGRDNTRSLAAAWIAGRLRRPLRLLFIGRHWERKGGDLVVDAASCLIKLGHEVALDVVGCEVPARHRALPWINARGALDVRDPAERVRLQSLLAAAHYVFVPSRAEAYGMTFAEACAFGVPAVATDTGGIPGVITEGLNGHLLPLSARGADYAEVIAASFANPDRYRALCENAFAEFERRLNWKAFARAFLDLAEERCLRRPRRGARPGDHLLAATA